MALVALSFLLSPTLCVCLNTHLSLDVHLPTFGFVVRACWWVPTITGGFLLALLLLKMVAYQLVWLSWPTGTFGSLRFCTSVSITFLVSSRFGLRMRSSSFVEDGAVEGCRRWVWVWGGGGGVVTSPPKLKPPIFFFLKNDKKKKKKKREKKDLPSRRGEEGRGEREEGKPNPQTSY